MLSKLIEESYKLLEESPHFNNPNLNSTIIKKRLPNGQYLRDTASEKAANVQLNRDLLAEKLRYLRRARDKSREAGKTYKANLVDNISRSLTNAPQGDPTLNLMINSSLNPMGTIRNSAKNIQNKNIIKDRIRTMQVLDKDERGSALTFKPRTVQYPYEKLNNFKNSLNDHMIDTIKRPENKLNNYFSPDDFDKMKRQLRQRNDRSIFGDKELELFKHQPRVASTIREPNNSIEIDPTQSNRMKKFYNLNKNEFINNHSSKYFN